MSVITSEDVQKLRTKTGAGFMDCKRALSDSAGDMDKAIKILREKGAASAAKRAGCAAGDGLVASYMEPSGKTAVLLELNCETDFVARTDDFKKFVVALAQQAGTAHPGWASVEDAPQEQIRELAAKLGENIKLRDKRFARFDLDKPGLFSDYIHPSGGVGKVGVVLEIGETSDKAEVLSSEEAKMLARDLAMQIAATSPRWVKKEDVPASVLEQEKAIACEQAKRDNKPEKIWDKISQGKVQQFYQQFCLLEQPFVKDAGGKTLVGQVIEQVSKKINGQLIPRRFVRFKVGEEE